MDPIDRVVPVDTIDPLEAIVLYSYYDHSGPTETILIYLIDLLIL